MPKITITELGKQPQPYLFRIEREETFIGRLGDNDINVDEESISTKHCLMRRVPGGFILQDLDSTNGIQMHGASYHVIDLADDMEVKLGDHVTLKFSLSEEEREILSKEPAEIYQSIKTPAPEKKPETVPLGEVASAVSNPQQDAASEKGSPLVTFFIIVLLLFSAGLAANHYKEAIHEYKDSLFPAKEASSSEEASSPATETSSPEEATQPATN